MTRTPRPVRTLALPSAMVAVLASALPVSAAESVALAQPWDPTPWVAVGSGVVIAIIVAADAKADRRGH